MSEYKAVVIGGSAGSFSLMLKILSGIKSDFKLPIILCMHRLKHVRSGIAESMRTKSKLPIIEPMDKQRIEPGVVYLAPANYHMFVELDGTVSLSTEEMNFFCRPSIDYTLSSCAAAYREKLVGIILTGANADGAKGLKDIADKKGYTIVQDPATAEVDTMPKSALAVMTPNEVLKPDGIIAFLNNL